MKLLIILGLNWIFLSGIHGLCSFTNDKGPKKGVPCVFPFKFDKVIYTTCTNAKDPDGLFWCSTQVDKNGAHVGGIDAWGYCDNDCLSSSQDNKLTTDNDNGDTRTSNFNQNRSPPFIGNVNQQFQSNRPLTRTTTTRSPLTIRRPTETTTRRTFVATTALPPSSFSNGLTDSGTYLPKPDKFECGTDVSGGFIVGGVDAKRGSYPFAAALGYRDPSGEITYACGGSLINRRYVLTAGHCQSSQRPIVRIKLGEHNFDSDPDCDTCKSTQIFDIRPQDVIVHPGFSVATVDSNGDDLALVRLPSAAVTINEDPDENVLPICVPWTGNELDSTEKNIVIGWGRTNNNPADTGDRFTSGVFSSILQQLEVPDVPVSECKSRYFKKLDLNKHICAGGILGQDSCKGDSGGPLIARNGRTGPMYLRGVVSFGTNKCGKGLPGVYTNVANYASWIQANMKP